jgi:threonine synthase
MKSSGSSAIAQQSMGNPEHRFPLFPPLVDGCPETSSDEIQFPLEIAYEYSSIDRTIFKQEPLPGLDRWAPLLPPLLDGLSMGEGGTPLIETPRLADWAGFDGQVFVKDESQNPTWSHKDRLNLCTVSAAIHSGAPGIVVASSGNHGASAAAYAARAGIPCVMFASAESPKAIISFALGYGAAVVTAPTEARWAAVRQVRQHLGYQPVSNQTTFHTGHPFGTEGYRTIAWELFRQLGNQVPGTVFVPTGYGEMLMGIAKGFVELRDLGVVDQIPAVVSCEPSARGPLASAVRQELPATTVEPAPTDAYAIGTAIGGFRGRAALQRSNGFPVVVSDDEMRAAQAQAGRSGIWQELSSSSSIAGLQRALADGLPVRGPVVCISTSSGFKDRDLGTHQVPQTGSDWPEIANALRSEYGIRA